jgi:hypothetical protein
MGMGNGDGLFDAGVGVIAANRQKKAAAQSKKDAQALRQQGLDFASGLNWEPELLSDHAPVYQRSQSPIADAFLQSLLTGDNAAMIQGTRHGAPQLKAAAQQRFDQSTGGFDALRARQREMEQSTPWIPKPFTEPAVTEQDKWKIQKPALARMGITPSEDAILNSGGVRLDGASGQEQLGRGLRPATVGGGKTIWGHTMTPEDYKALAAAGEAGDQEAIRRILMGDG